MQAIFNFIYLIVFLSYILLSMFIIYHLVRYSGNRSVMAFTVTFFLIGTACLLFANALLFFSIPFDQFIPALNMPTYSPKAPF
ncbi:MAG: hypothetical protein PHT88_05015 [Candidatus Moranbacteria bacterium]|nr:hypothetical protein [Candidatus Moranbacteria bacterium]